MRSSLRRFLCAAATLLFAGLSTARAASGPYFNTYTHDMEEGEWEVALGADAVLPRNKSASGGFALELEHGFNSKFSAALYLLGTKKAGESPRFDGFKLEGRWRPFERDFFFFPAVYLEYEQFFHEETYRNVVVGNREEEPEGGGLEAAPFRSEHEVEARLLFSQDFNSGNVALNLAGEKNLDGGKWGFGYTLGVFLKGPERIRGGYDTGRAWDRWLLYGVEAFGGLGESGDIGVHPERQNHYIQPFVSFPLKEGTLLKVAFAKGITSGAEDRLRFYLVFHL